MFPNVHHQQTVNLVQSATATETYLDIVLVLDRSGSMGWDLSGNDWQYLEQHGSLFSGPVIISNSSAGVYAKFPGKDNYTGILNYQVY